jgi:DNA-binding NarL/FixJ family response regulator
VTRFLIVEDHPLFCEALQSAIRATIPDAELFEASSIDETLEVLSSIGAVDLILLDLAIRGETGLTGLIRIRKEFPRSPILVVSAHQDPHIIASALSLGVSGYIPKSASKAEIAHSIEEVLQGAICFPGVHRTGARGMKVPAQDLLKRLHDLTPQQLRVLDLLRRGLQNKQIAYQLHICETTVKVHVSEILRKLNVMSRTRAIIEMSKIDFASLASGHSAKPALYRLQPRRDLDAVMPARTTTRRATPPA